MLTACLDGFGRFGLHLLRHWLDLRASAAFRIVAISDTVLSPAAAARILERDSAVRFDDFEIAARAESLVLAPRDGEPVRIRYFRGETDACPALGEADLLLVASGHHTSAHTCRPLLRGRTRRAVVSASCEGADQTLVFGFNHHEWRPESEVLSYGSCTINAFVPLAAWIHATYGLLDADVNVVHNTPRHRGSSTLERRDCTLERWGPRLLPFLAADRFAVNYTLVPFAGVSLLDFRFRVARPVARSELLAGWSDALGRGALARLYRCEPTGRPLVEYLGATENAIFLADRLRVRGDQIYLHAVCDTENSAARYFDLVDYVARGLCAPGEEPDPGAGTGTA